jgi:hypothetical protein
MSIYSSPLKEGMEKRPVRSEAVHSERWTVETRL